MLLLAWIPVHSGPNSSQTTSLLPVLFLLSAITKNTKMSVVKCHPLHLHIVTFLSFARYSLSFEVLISSYTELTVATEYTVSCALTGNSHFFILCFRSGSD